MRETYRAMRPLLPRSIREVVATARQSGRIPNIWRPSTFSEKLLHRKVFGYDPRFATCADKVAVRAYVMERVGEPVLNEVYQVAHSFQEIDLASLPNSFVIKATHDVGSARVIDDKNQAPWSQIEAEFDERLQRTFGGDTGEYWYEEIPPRVMVERRIVDDTYSVPLDYKFFVFHGVVRVVQVFHDRGNGTKQRLYDRDWQSLPARRRGAEQAAIMPKPATLDEMIEAAEALGKGFEFVRVDLYSPNSESVIFGEMTFAPSKGYISFDPPSFDRELGEYW